MAHVVYVCAGWYRRKGLDPGALKVNDRNTLRRASCPTTLPEQGVRRQRERVLFIGTRYSNLYTAVNTPAEAKD